KMMIFSPLPCFTTSAVTAAPPSSGAPTFTSSSDAPSRTSLKVTVSPASALSDGIRSVCPGSARNCFPPVRRMADMMKPAPVEARLPGKNARGKYGRKAGGSQVGGELEAELASAGAEARLEGCRPPAGREEENSSFQLPAPGFSPHPSAYL